MVGTLENVKNKEIFWDTFLCVERNDNWYKNEDNSKALLHVGYSEAPSPASSRWRELNIPIYLTQEKLPP